METDFSLRWASELTGYSRSYLSLLLNGHRPPNTDMLKRMQARLGWAVENQALHLDDYGATLHDVLTAHFHAGVTGAASCGVCGVKSPSGECWNCGAVNQTHN